MMNKKTRTTKIRRSKNSWPRRISAYVANLFNYLSVRSFGLLFTILGLALAIATFYFNFVHKTRALYFSASNENVSMMEGGAGVALLLSNTGNTPVTISSIYAEVASARNPDYLDGHNPFNVKSIADGTKKWQPLLTNPAIVNPGTVYSDTVVICMLYPFFIQSEQQISLRVDIVDYLGNQWRIYFPLETVKWATGYAGAKHAVIGYTNVIVPVEHGAFNLFEHGLPVGLDKATSGSFGRFDCSDNANPPGMTKPPI